MGNDSPAGTPAGAGAKFSGAKKFAMGNAFPLAAFALVFSYIMISLLAPFFLQNNLYNYDMAGMYASSWYTANYLFPSPIGWNPYFFFGFAQSQFYGPLYPYLTSIFALALPTDVAFKCVLALTLLLTPVSFYFFSRSFGFSRNNSAAIMLLMFGLLFAFPYGDYGGNINATFGVGFVAQALSIPLFFFYFGSLRRSFDSQKLAIPSLLLALTILAHTWTGFAAVFISIAFFLSRPGTKTALYLGSHLLLAFFLTAFWSVPMVAKIGYLAISHIGKMAFSLELLAATVGIILLARRKKERRAHEPLLFLLAILLACVIGDALKLPVHFYRLTMLVYLMAPIALLSFFRGENKIVHAACLCLAAISVFTLTGLHPEGYSIIKKIAPLPFEIDGRLLVNAPPQRQSNVHELTEMVAVQSRSHGVVGLFSDSSKNSRYAFDLLREFDSANLNWGVVTDDRRIDSMGEGARLALIPGQLEALGIKYVLTSSSPLPGWKLMAANVFTPYIKDNAGQMHQYPYSLYAANNTGIISVLRSAPRYAEKDKWQNEVTEWFLSGRAGEGELVDEPVPGFAGSGKEGVKILEQSKTMERIKFFVDSQKSVPVLIKISQFPNWRAYQSGSPLHIYRASPYFMLVYGYGEIELRYEQTPPDIAGHVMTFIGAVAAIALWRKKNECGNLPP